MGYVALNRMISQTGAFEVFGRRENGFDLSHSWMVSFLSTPGHTSSI